MKNRKRSKIQTICNAGLLIGVAGLIGVVGGRRLIEEQDLYREMGRFPKVEVQPMYGEGLDSLSGRYVEDLDKYHTNLRHNFFFQDNPGFSGRLEYGQNYVIRSNNLSKTSSQ